MRIAILGGSFNPVHIGHLALADDVCVSLGYDRILFVPASVPPHKELRAEVPAWMRLRMAELAVEGDERFAAEPCEIEREGVSYTWDTVLFLEKKYAASLEGRIGLIMGSDLFSGFRLWKNAEELSRRCELILAARPPALASSEFMNSAKGGYADVQDSGGLVPDDPIFSGARILSNPRIPVSSSEIRERISRGSSFKYLVPNSVFDYIMRENLYGL